MTISITTSRIDYIGDGSTTALPVPFPFFEGSELRVVSRTLSTGVEAVKTLGVHYTVTGGAGGTGTVTASVAPPATEQWTILRNTARTQLTDYTSNDEFPAETHERALDRLQAQIQEIERDALRSVRVAETDPSSVTLPTSVDRAGKVLAFDEDGNPQMVDFDANGVQGPAGPAGPSGVMIGEIKEWPGSTLPPGCLWCDGALYSATDYPELYAKIGTTYNTGGEAGGTFRVPDKRGRGAIGRDNMGGTAANRVTSAVSGLNGASLGATGGDQRLHGHTHGVTDTGHVHGGSIGAAGAHGHTIQVVTDVGSGGAIGGSGGFADSLRSTSNASDHTHTLTINNATTGIAIQTGGAGSSQNIPPSIVHNFVIVARALEQDPVIPAEAPTDGKYYARRNADWAEIPAVERVFSFAVSDETTALTTGDGKVTLRAPYAMTLSSVRASLTTASSSGLVTVNIRVGGSDIFSTALTIDANEKTSTTAATSAVLSSTSVADDAEIIIDIDGAGTGAKGLKIYMIGAAP